MGIQYEVVQKLAIIFIGSLAASVFAGLALLKFYEEFKKGVEQNSRFRIWSAFFGLSFLILFFFLAFRSL